MATPEEIIKKVNSGEIVKFSKQYWQNFVDYLNFYGIDFKCRMVIDGNAVLVGPDKSPSPCRHTLEDGADATTELVSGKSSGLIGGMRQEKPMADERIDINQEELCKNCTHFEPSLVDHGWCTFSGIFEPVTTNFYCDEFCEQIQGHKRIS